MNRIKRAIFLAKCKCIWSRLMFAAEVLQMLYHLYLAYGYHE